MLNHLATEDIAIIGQSPAIPSPVLPTTLAALRAPTFLSNSLAEFLFQNQWMYWLIAATVVATLYYVGRSRADRRLMNGGLALAGVLALWLLAATLIDTPRERLYRCHKDLAAAAQANDVNRIISYLSDHFRAPALNIEGRQTFHDELATRLKSYEIRSNTITAYRSDLSDKSAFTTITLITETGIAGPVRSTWQLSWDDVAGEDWRVAEANLVKLGDEAVRPEQVLPR